MEEVEGNYVRVMRTSGPSMEQAFIHLVPRGPGIAPAESWPCVDAHVDLDADGNVMGVMLAWDLKESPHG